MMSKLQFEFTVVTSPKDTKTNVIAITSICTEDGKRYILPEELRYMGDHVELKKSNYHTKLVNSLKKRNQVRKVWITMTKELEETYIDEDGNLQFKDQYLEEINEENLNKTQDHNLKEILEKLIETTQNKDKDKEKNLKQIADKLLIEKFSSKNTNAKQWMESFEKECSRFQIDKKEDKIELLKLFLDKPSLDWYSSTLIRLTVNAGWSEWKKRFLECFTDNGWNNVTYALSFKYREGSLTDYAIKKEKLLIDFNKDMDVKSLIALIAVGLPEFILNKIVKSELKETTDLFNNLRQLECQVRKNFQKKFTLDFQKNIKCEEKKPCKTCEDLGKGVRYHPNEKCWFKRNEESREKNITTKKVNNNSILDVEVYDKTKNE